MQKVGIIFRIDEKASFPYDFSMKKKPRLGRPPKPKGKKFLNPVRQVGRWDDASWGVIQKAAERKGLSVAEYVRDTILPIARKESAE